ncbi:MAG: M48 family metalloprotease [Candidatus Solibacter sp.]
MKRRMRVPYASVLFLAVLPVAAQEPVGVGDVNGYSLEKERALGQQLASEIRLKTRALNSPAVQEYVEHLGQKIAPHIQGARFDYTFNLIVDDTLTHEPAALPGGVIFVPAALFAGANDEAEFAGMLAHAMEHVAQRHGTLQTTGNITGNNTRSYASIPLIFMDGWLPGRDVAIPLRFMAQLRSSELEADASSVEAMAHAGFDPAALVRYLERVRPGPPGTQPKVFSRLPDHDQRIAALGAAIARLPQARYAEPATEFAAIREEVAPLMAQPENNPATRQRQPPTLRRQPPTLTDDRPTLKRKQ